MSNQRDKEKDSPNSDELRNATDNHSKDDKAHLDVSKQEDTMNNKSSAASAQNTKPSTDIREDLVREEKHSINNDKGIFNRVHK